MTSGVETPPDSAVPEECRANRATQAELNTDANIDQARSRSRSWQTSVRRMMNINIPQTGALDGEMPTIGEAGIRDAS